ncbi:preprotein translocase subunit SecA [Tissierella sp. P1]|uniref:preprotein translocase subunit SecA n=1 Tax=Tissierella sp. P1 TaxID=1280483 RepID=UPI000BA00EE7|nr:preprotein translocase subunit SecA [Tissierella sp. P1]MDU5079708.1 preprotein translocase subunit SecA [Bacillota bacterium]OZV10952.1 preprotein translocase subunit SecA [Tissierella sp. P1]
MASLFEKLFGTYSDRELKKITPLVDKIESLDGEMQKLTDQQLKEKTLEFKNRLNQNETLDDILPEAFAVVREASYRVLGIKHFRVQLIGGIILHQGRISEMKTGEGKTLMATLPAYLNALTGKGVHIVTVNDYLAKRDKEWMGKVYEFLGLTVGCIVHGISNQERKAAYNYDITYGTNNEFGFDYLRDNMVIYKEDMVQRPLYFAIVDEVDSILVDEARTPLIISGTGDKSTKLYEMADSFARTLTSRIMDPGEEKMDPFNREIKEETVDYVIDEKAKSCSITEKGTAKAESFFGIENLSDIENMEIAHHVNQALKARSIMKRDIDYVVKDGEVIIVDEFTGRLMYGRRYSDGLHQAIEAKEKLNVKSESKTLATITFQNYFRMYTKLSGMTGTAKTEEAEFREIYDMDVVEIPTNKPVIRQDLADVIYRSEEAKFRAVVREIKEKHATGQPILVGTITIERSELLSKMLKKEGIPHEVLNAKHHDREAEIVAQAGRFGSVTIATNMAGRGTDIVLGGNPEFLAKQEMRKKGFTDEILSLVDSFYDTDNEEVLAARKTYQELHDKYKVETDAENKKVLEAGGLHIIGTERHESRRIDNQLRGRAGRQGDPGSSRFYISLEDDLMRLFGGERIINLIDGLKMPEDEPLEHSMLTKSIENAQKKVEGNNFGIRKHVLKYDDVMNKQREVIYGERRKVLEGEDLRSHIQEMAKSLVMDNIEIYTRQSKYPEEWDLEGLENYVMNLFDINKKFLSFTDIESITKEALIDKIIEKAEEKYKAKELDFGEERFREVERVVLLQVVDSKWMDHIDAMDQLRQGIGLRAYGQEDPVRAYQNEGFDMFNEMTHSIWEDTVRFLYQVENPEKVQRKKVAEPVSTNADEISKTIVNKEKKVGRNDPCPCGSGKKYKKCCGQNE